MAKTLNDVIDSISSAAYEILEYRAGIALGKEPPPGAEMYDKAEQLRIIKIVSPLLPQIQQSKSIDAQNSNEILSCLSAGKITVSEAMQLMKLLREKADVDIASSKVKIQKKIEEII